MSYFDTTIPINDSDESERRRKILELKNHLPQKVIDEALFDKNMTAEQLAYDQIINHKVLTKDQAIAQRVAQSMNSRNRHTQSR